MNSESHISSDLRIRELLCNDGYIQSAAKKEFFDQMFSDIQKIYPEARFVSGVGFPPVNQIVYLPEATDGVLSKLRKERELYWECFEKTGAAIRSIEMTRPQQIVSADTVSPSIKAWIVHCSYNHRALRSGDVVIVVETPEGQNLLLKPEDMTMHTLTDIKGQYVKLVELDSLDETGGDMFATADDCPDSEEPIVKKIKLK